MEFKLSELQQDIANLAKDFAAGDIAADTASSSAYDSASGEWLLTYAAASAEGQLNSFTLKHSSLADIKVYGFGQLLFGCVGHAYRRCERNRHDDVQHVLRER